MGARVLAVKKSVPSQAELTALAREVMAKASGLSAAQLKAVLPKPMQRHRDGVLAALRSLAAQGELHRYTKGKTERFFARDPLRTLADLALDLLRREGPIEEPELKRAVERVARGHGDLLAEWLKGAAGRREVFEHAPLRGKTKRYGLSPDPALLLKKPIAELKKALAVTDAAGVPREALLRALENVLGLTTRKVSLAASRADVEHVRTELRALAAKSRPGTVLLLTDLRSRAHLDKTRFDGAVLALAAEGSASIHHHDYVARLTDAQRSELVTDGTLFYVGITPRSSP